MTYPQLVPSGVCTTPIHLEIYGEDLDRYGQPKVILKLDTTCNYQCTSQKVLTDKEIATKVVSTALFNGDIATGIAEITSGTATIMGETRHIEKCSKVRNLDGSVNFTRLYLK